LSPRRDTRPAWPRPVPQLAAGPGWRARRLALALVAVAAVGASYLIGGIRSAQAATLATAVWSSSSTVTGATGASYTYAFTVATASSLSSVTMTVPSGTSGSATVAAVSPASLAGGSVALAGTTLTYSFTAASVSAGTAVSIKVSGLTNTGTAGAYTSTLTTMNGASAVDTGTTGSFTFTGIGLSSPSWTASSTTVGATGTSYTYTFTVVPTVLQVVSSVTMTVPPGTGGTPALGAVSPGGILGGTLTLSGTTLTYSGLSLTLLSSTTFSIQVTGLTNTATAGNYTAEIVTYSLGVAVDAGVSTLSLTGPLALTLPTSLSWGLTLNGGNQSIVDMVASHQQLTISDQTLTGAGWHVTVAATTLSTGGHALANTGTLVLTGSVSSVAATTAPSATCAPSCVPPSDAVTYPVAITTAATSPTPAEIYNARAASGLGAITLGGPSPASPAGWWVNVPANAWAGTYTSTVTLAIVLGP
jgi:hypothetical protein